MCWLINQSRLVLYNLVIGLARLRPVLRVMNRVSTDYCRMINESNTLT